MKALVTAIGNHRGAPAFEYELRGANDTVQAVDYVVLHARNGESWTDLAEFVRGWLMIRAAKWELSDTPEARARRKESRVGVRLGNSDAPRVGNRSPMRANFVEVAVDRSMAQRLRFQEVDMAVFDEQGKPTGEIRREVLERFAV